MGTTHAFPGKCGGSHRFLSINLTLVALVVFLLVGHSGSLSAAAPVSPLEVDDGGAAVRRAGSPFDAVEGDHRQLLRKRHDLISSGSVASGFVHPTHLYRRDADALPPPDKSYNLTVTQGTISPDGFERLGFLMNGKFPADPFVWDENDDVEITVNNQGPVPFAIHWHGIHQIGTPEMDGVPGLSQWNIYSGESYTYRFKLINQHGGYWYHSHERGYYADGLRGTIYIRPKPDRKKPWSLISEDQDDIDQMEAAENDFQVMSLSDHWHINHTDMLLVVHETGVPPACFDSLQINGRGRQYCVGNWSSVMSPVQASLLKNFSSTNPEGVTSKGCISLVPPKDGYTVKGTLDTRYGGVCQNTTAPLTVFSASKAIKEGRRWLNLQIIDTATNWYYGISIDGHKMWLVAVDGHYIHPLEVDWAQITIGSRLSVMIELDPDLDGNIFPIRLTGARALQAIEGHAFLSYIDGVDGSWNPDIEEDFGYAMRTLSDAHVPMSGFVVDPSVIKWQQNLSAPFDPISEVPQTSNMTLHAVASQNSLNVWQLATMPLDTAHLADERPMLFNATDGNATSNQMTPYAAIPFGTVVDIIMENNIYSIVGGPNSPHPFHMHSRRFWIIGSGAGPFPADTVAEAQEQGVVFNLDNPPLRDGFDIDSNSWVVIRYIVDHSAANILHCHIDDHAIEGMAAVLLEGLEKIPAGGNFSEAIKARPAKYVETQNDELGQVLEQSWATGSVNAKYVAPAATETVTPWGDPRSLANSIQLFASSNSVQKSITSSLQEEFSLAQATATEGVTAITATVSDYLTTFTGAASAVSLATAAQSTVVAIAYTTKLVTANAAQTLAAVTSATAAPLSTLTLTVTATAPAVATAAASSSVANVVQQTAVPTSSAVTPASLIAYSTLYSTLHATSSKPSATTSAASIDDDKDEDEETEVATKTSTRSSSSTSTQSASSSDTDTESEDESDEEDADDDDDDTSSTSLGTRTLLSSASTAKGLATSVGTNLAASTARSSSTHVYSQIATQQVITSALTRAASALLAASSTAVQAIVSSAAAVAPTQAAAAVSTPTTPVLNSLVASADSTQLAIATADSAAKYGTYSASATFLAYSASTGAITAAAVAPSATAGDEELAYDDPVFPSTAAAAAAATQRAITTSNAAASASASAGASDGDDQDGDYTSNDEVEQYTSE
ncbi:related to Laccase I precursor [Sporisorium reilianum f. sp. reilianum]|uniref:Related to Laccase I n=1 Tax=Sporisorium reilianum f. sp. reilianum TaxID=72559 RepID=A0A2N8UM26_9BASI|nr:related to Laccase I precursor [Sporisorium reilianum f. sp. reilianum]